ncbi:heavy metal translocating P-type ATPase [Ectothiorhodospira shaposhnikovii]|uniref:heavy metal translocating P-type ATPase n=1 Tax=Ectothiorhodospira shaposhnikovii TaxID=1054 RepID=UPI0039A36D1C
MNAVLQSALEPDAPGEARACFHCGLPVPAGSDFSLTVDGEIRGFCCPGCRAVAAAIIDAGLGDYYRHRTEKAGAPPDPAAALDALALYDSEQVQRGFVHVTPGNLREASLMLEGIVCAACVWLSERHVQSLPGVVSFAVNYSTHRARVRWDQSRISLSAILRAITEIGYRAHPFDPGRQEAVFRKERDRALRRLAVAGLGMMQVMMIAVALWLGHGVPGQEDMMQFLRWVAMLVAAPVVFYAGAGFFVSAWRDLRRRRLGMDVPVALAIGSTFVASAWATMTGHPEHVYFESVTMFVFFLLTGRYLEMAARQRAGQATESLGRLLPAVATRVGDDGDEEVPVTELLPGDRVRIRPGAPVPADGVVLSGTSSVDESLLTGESLPRRRATGDALVGGTVNVESPLVMRVDQVGQDTVLSSIQRLLERAQTEKPPMALLAERGTGGFVAAVLLLTLVTGLVWWLWVDPARAFWVMVTMLVVSCPCALALATPAAITAATGALTGRGLLTARGQALEHLAGITDVVFDKTGTLTEGRLSLRKVAVLGDVDEAGCLEYARILEAGSEHPVGRVFQRVGSSGGPSSAEAAAAGEVRAHPGRGMEGVIRGRRLRIGAPDFVRELGADTQADPRLVRLAEQWPHGGHVVLGDDQGLLAAFVLEDRTRPDALEAVAGLKARGITVHLFSGDAPAAVSFLARQLGIEDARGGLSPADKLTALEALQSAGRTVAMVGDGVNDAPVLSKAHVSVAMAGGTQLAQSGADMILYRDQPGVLPAGLDKARETVAVIRQNIRWAIGYNALALPVAAAGLLTPWLAALGMSLSSLLVVVNALRLRDSR